MQDALLCYYMLLNMRHAGHFLIVADLFRGAIAGLQLRRLAASLRRRGTWPRTWPGTRPAARCAGAAGGFRQDWAERLMRLENHVTAMA